MGLFYGATLVDVSLRQAKNATEVVAASLDAANADLTTRNVVGRAEDASTSVSRASAHRVLRFPRMSTPPHGVRMRAVTIQT